MWYNLHIPGTKGTQVPLVHLSNLPSASFGTLMYHLLVLLALEAMFGVTLIGQRFSLNPGHRRRLWAFAGLLALRIPLLLGSLFDLSIVAPVISGMEVGSVVLLGSVFAVSAPSLRVRRLYLLVGLSLTLMCIAIFLPGWNDAFAAAPNLAYDSFWHQSVWHAMSVFSILIPAVILRRHRGHEGHWLPTSGHAALGLGFLALLISSLLPSQSGRGAIPDILSNLGWLFNLAGYLLFAVAVCRSILEDMRAYRGELQSTGEEALGQIQELLFLVETTRAISECLDLDTILHRVAESVTTALSADRCAIFLIEPDESETIHLAAQHAVLQRGERGIAHTPVTLAEQSVLDHALKRREQLILNDEADYERLEILYELLGRQEAGPTIVQPLLRQHRVLGVLVVGNDRSQRAFGPKAGRLCQSIATQVAAAVENACLYHDLAIQSDQLAELLQLQEDGVRRQTAVLESIGDGVIVSDQEGRVTVANAAAEQILNTHSDHILGQPLERVIGHTALGAETDWESVAQAGGLLQTVFELENRIVHVNAAPVLTSAGDPAGVVAILRDITGEAEAERAKSTFITAISHELRTPITAIRGYAEALSSGMVGAVSQTQSHFLGIIRDNALRMVSLTENLTAVSEIEKGFLSLEYEETDLRSLIYDVVLSFKSQIENCQLEVSLAVDDNLPLIEADPSRVRRILDNLVSNAIKFTYPGGRITIGVRSLDGERNQTPMHCTIWVSDTGIGISPEEQAHIWERFYRPASPLVEQTSGLGMGLSVVKSLVEAHGGRVWMESAPSVGSTFTVLLPIKRTRHIDQPSS